MLAKLYIYISVITLIITDIHIIIIIYVTQDHKHCTGVPNEGRNYIQTVLYIYMCVYKCHFSLQHIII